MALTDVLFMSGNSASAGRGDIGTLEDVLPDDMTNRLFITVPIAAQVESGVVFGRQDSQTGTFIGGGGGSGVSRGRIVNA